MTAKVSVNAGVESKIREKSAGVKDHNGRGSDGANSI
jgi:hypothetical protein